MESLIQFCKEIDFATENSGKFNHRNSPNYPATSGNSGFFMDDKLAADYLAFIRLLRVNESTSY